MASGLPPMQIGGAFASKSGRRLALFRDGGECKSGIKIDLRLDRALHRSFASPLIPQRCELS